MLLLKLIKVAVRVTAFLLRVFQNLGESLENDSWSKFRPLLDLTTFVNFFAEIDPPWLVHPRKVAKNRKKRQTLSGSYGMSSKRSAMVGISMDTSLKGKTFDSMIFLKNVSILSYGHVCIKNRHNFWSKNFFQKSSDQITDNQNAKLFSIGHLAIRVLMVSRVSRVNIVCPFSETRRDMR